MPYYRYKCTDCGESSTEKRAMDKRREPMACPSCDGQMEFQPVPDRIMQHRRDHTILDG